MIKFRESEESVASVISVILLLGITVIMVSLIAISLFGFTIPEGAPQAKIVVVEARGI